VNLSRRQHHHYFFHITIFSWSQATRSRWRRFSERRGEEVFLA
jgi:hypothetical protein